MQLAGACLKSCLIAETAGELPSASSVEVYDDLLGDR